MLAQTLFARGFRTVLVLGQQQLATRMYASLGEIIRGWQKNVFAGGSHALPPIRLARAVFPFLLPLPALVQLVPLALLVASLLTAASHALLLWSALTSALLTIVWLMVYAVAKQPPFYALLFPLGASLMLYIVLSATLRGHAVEWKGRSYQNAAASASME